MIQGDMKDLSEQLKGNIQVISNKYQEELLTLNDHLSARANEI